MSRKTSYSWGAFARLRLFRLIAAILRLRLIRLIAENRELLRLVRVITEKASLTRLLLLLILPMTENRLI
jgi:hypothetical protein